MSRFAANAIICAMYFGTFFFLAFLLVLFWQVVAPTDWRVF